MMAVCVCSVCVFRRPWMDGDCAEWSQVAVVMLSHCCTLLIAVVLECAAHTDEIQKVNDKGGEIEGAR